MNKLIISIAGENTEQQQLSFIDGVIPSGKATSKDSLTVSYKAKHSLITWSSNISHTYSSNHLKGAYAWKLILVLFIITINRKQPVSLSVSEQIKKNGTFMQWGIYSLIKRNELLSNKRHRCFLSVYL